MSEGPRSGEYDLAELCRMAGVTQRTVRYYIQQGLLEPPDSRGPKARYAARHLERLRLVKQLQSRHLPLAEIRGMLDELSEEGIREALGQAAPERASSALDYIAAVRGSRWSPAASPLPHDESDSEVAERHLALMHDELEMPDTLETSAALEVPEVSERQLLGRIAFGPPPPPPAEATFGRRSQWERIVLGPNVELQVRRPLSRAENRAVERLLQVAHELFHPDRGDES